MAIFLLVTWALVGLALGGGFAKAEADHRQRCGSFRWDVKTLTDPAASRVDLTPTPSTIEELERFAPPEPVKKNTPRLSFEISARVIVGRLVGYKLEDDGDIHAAIEGDAGGHLVAEFPAPNCTYDSVGHDSVAAGAFKIAREAFLAAVPRPPTAHYFRFKMPLRVEVAGPIYADECTAAHHPTGAGPHCIEIHGVTSFRVLEVLEVLDGGAR